MEKKGEKLNQKLIRDSLIASLTSRDRKQATGVYRGVADVMVDARDTSQVSGPPGNGCVSRLDKTYRPQWKRRSGFSDAYYNALQSALRFHELTTQAPYEAWVAIPNKAHAPSTDYPPLRVVRFSGKALTEGIETHQVDGVAVRVTCIARTVADCFKFRNKIGLDVALEALNDAWNTQRIKMDDLWRYAEVCRVTNVIRPYLEGLTS